MPSLLSVLGYAALGTVSMIVGGTAAAYWPPSARWRSYTQHVAAGLVFAAATIEVLPDVMHRNRWRSRWSCSRSVCRCRRPWGTPHAGTSSV